MMSRKLLPKGTILNRYRIERIIGVGGFGVTYLAMEPIQQNYVAIKEYFPKHLANRHTGNIIVPNRTEEDQRIFKWGLKRFLDEAKVLARLYHPNIIKVQRYFEMHGTAYLVMEYCDGKPLDIFVDDSNAVPPRSIFQIYTSLISALEHVHQQGIIHGDLKPSNVLVRTDGTPVLLDFGSARQEMMRMAVGQVSDGYSPPEFYGASDIVGPWSDIYGLGATFYKLITGVKVPAASIRSKSDSYLSVSNAITDGYDATFLELIDNSLKLSTSERPQSILALKRLLPKSANFSNRHKITKYLREELPKLSYPNSTTFNWKPAVIILSTVVSVGGGLAVLNLFVNDSIEVDLPAAQKVSPIVIEDHSVVTETPVVIPKNTTSLPTANTALQQALTYLERISSSSEISWYSIPKNEQAVRTFKFVESEIDKKFDSAFDRKSFIYIESRKEYLFKDFSLSNIQSLGFIATDAKCTDRPKGPVTVSCWRSDRDFKCRLIDLSIKYEYTCLYSFSLQ